MSRRGAKFEVDDTISTEVVQDGGGGVFESVDVIAELVDVFREEREETARVSYVSTSFNQRIPPHTPLTRSRRERQVKS